MDRLKRTKRELVLAAYNKLIDVKDITGLTPYQFNFSGEIDPNKFMQWAHFYIKEMFQQDVKRTTIERYLREFTSKSA